jgi:hypothetical protein
MFLREGTLMAQPFDTEHLALTGEAVPVAEGVGSAGSRGWFSVSASGTLAYRTTGGSATNEQLTWYDRKGLVLGKVGDPAPFVDLALSPSRLAFYQIGGQSDISLLDLASGAISRFTFNPAIDRYPVWSPDGSKIAFGSDRGGTMNLYVKPSNGARNEEQLTRSSDPAVPTSWSRDGRFLFYMVTNPKTKYDIWVLPMKEDGGSSGMPDAVPLLRMPFNEGYASLSPDSRWLAYLSDESGRDEVYVQPFEATGRSGGPALGEGQWQISSGGVARRTPRWREDGKELYFVAANAIMSVEVSASGAFRAGTPQIIRPTEGVTDGAITADGKRLLLAVPPGRDKPQSITILLNWQAALKK